MDPRHAHRYCYRLGMLLSGLRSGAWPVDKADVISADLAAEPAVRRVLERLRRRQCAVRSQCAIAVVNMHVSGLS